MCPKRIRGKRSVPSILEMARSYVAAGLSVLPIAADGSKAPAGMLPIGDDGRPTWKPLQSRLPAEEELAAWYGNCRTLGIGIIGGRISGNLLILDFDDPTLFEPWKDLVTELVKELAPGVVERLPIIKTPSGGFHVYVKSNSEIKGGKLARRSPDEAGRR